MGGVFLQGSEGFVPSPLRSWEDGTRPAGKASLGARSPELVWILGLQRCICMERHRLSGPRNLQNHSRIARHKGALLLAFRPHTLLVPFQLPGFSSLAQQTAPPA